MHRDEVAAEAERREQREADARGDAPVARLVLARREADADERDEDPGDLRRRRVVAGREADGDRNDRRDARDRRDDAHRADGHAAVVGAEAERPRHGAGIASSTVASCGASPWISTASAIASSPATCAVKSTRSAPSVRPLSGPKKSAKPHARLARECERRAYSGIGPRRGDGVELVRVVERRGLGGARRAQVVVHRDGVQQLRGSARAPRARGAPRCTWPSSRPSSVGRNAGGGPSSRVRPTSCTSAAASRRSARRRGWSCASSWQIVATPTVCSSSPPAYEWWPSSVAGYARSGVSASTRRDERAQRLVVDLRREERRRIPRARPRRAAAPARARPDRRPRARARAPRAGAGRGTSPRVRGRARRRPRRSARRAARRRSTRGRRCGRSRRRARARGTARRSACAASASSAPRRRRRRPGSPRGRERRSRELILRYGPVVADVRPFRAERYSERAGPLEDLVAPPYDVIGPEERREYLARSPYNVVHLTLPDSEERGRARARGVARASRSSRATTEPACWALSQSYVGPDGVVAHAERRRRGAPARAVRAPGRAAARADARERRRRSACACCARRGRSSSRSSCCTTATRVELPDREPDLALGGERLWRIDCAARRLGAAADRRRPPPLRDRARVPRRGRHRGERVDDGRARVDARGGADDLPDASHRAARRRRRRRRDRAPGERAAGRRRLPRATATGSSKATASTSSSSSGFAPEGVSYTPRREEAEAAVDRGDAEAALLVRPAPIDAVFERARRGEVLPQKTTYFFPKLTQRPALLSA